jgi:hypothetical protein
VTANDSTAPYCTFPSMLASRLGMSYSISTLLLRNLGDVFGENDAARRRAALDELWNEDGVFYDPRRGAYRGRDEIDRIAGAIKATHPDFHYQPISEPEELGNGGRVKMGSGPLRCAAVLTPEPISLSPATAASPLSTSFSTSYPELDLAANDIRMTNVCRRPGLCVS